jgi:hypothetical protein
MGRHLGYFDVDWSPDLHGERMSAPCIVCDKALESLFDDIDQPRAAAQFTSHGHYGSAFDEMGEVTAVVNVCDDCMGMKAVHVEIRQYKRQRPLETYTSQTYAEWQLR